MTYVRMTTEHLSASAMPDQTPIAQPTTTEGVMESSDGSRGILSPSRNIALWVWVMLALVITIITCCIIMNTAIVCHPSRKRKKKACCLSKVFDVVPLREERIEQTNKKEKVTGPEILQLKMDSHSFFSQRISPKTSTTFKPPVIHGSLLVNSTDNNVIGMADVSVPAGCSSGSQGHTTIEHALDVSFDIDSFEIC